MHTMTKVMAVVACLCKIHNFLIDQRGEQAVINIPPHTDNDELTMTLQGAVPMEASRAGHTDRVPQQLFDAGAHFDDDPGRRIRRRRTVTHRQSNSETTIQDSNQFDPAKLPRENLCMKVSAMHLRRPV